MMPPPLGLPGVVGWRIAIYGTAGTVTVTVRVVVTVCVGPVTVCVGPVTVVVGPVTVLVVVTV